MPNYLARMLFPRVPRQVRQRKMQALRFGVAAALLTAAAVAAMIYAVSTKVRP